MIKLAFQQEIRGIGHDLNELPVSMKPDSQLFAVFTSNETLVNRNGIALSSERASAK